MVKVATHRFIINFIARYPDMNDTMILHWGMSRKKVGAWGTPDDEFMPLHSARWPDGLACQSPFQKDKENPSINFIQFAIKWAEEVEHPVNSISFVITEKTKNVWHSINGQDSTIQFCPET